MVDASTRRLRVFVLLLAVVVAVGTVGFTLAEDLSLGDSLYLTIVTVATVGYGDLHPSTAVGKTLAVFLILGGAGSFLGVFTGVAETTFSRRERRERLQNLHLVIGVFFSELGNDLLRRFSVSDTHRDELVEHMSGMGVWTRPRFVEAGVRVRSHQYRLTTEHIDLAALHQILLEKRPLLVRILENPTLQEHERFTDLLRATFHLAEELAYRPSLLGLEEKDAAHLVGDAARVYGQLVPQWLDYVTHLHGEYPYLFSLAARTNPFDAGSSVHVE
ncbi:MAG: potassium channel family protein [Thermoleophilia bacterium]